jgi:hypothetical protein
MLYLILDNICMKERHFLLTSGSFECNFKKFQKIVELFMKNFLDME